MKIAFLPVSILGGILAGVLARKTFDVVWAKVDEEEPPQPDHRQASITKLVLALLVEGAIFRLVKGLFDHGARRGFERLTGEWPGDEHPDRA
jgi:hypothetical protein